METEREEIIYEAANQQLSRQLETVDVLASKVNNMLVICGVCIGLYVELWRAGYHNSLTCGGIAIAFATVLLLHSFRTRQL